MAIYGRSQQRAPRPTFGALAHDGAHGYMKDGMTVFTRTVTVLLLGTLVLGGCSEVTERQSPRTTADGEGVSERLTGDAMMAEVRSLEKAVPLPPSGSFDDIDWQELDGQSRTGILSFLQFNASCDWYVYWLDGFENGDAAGMASAMDTLKSIPNWETIRGGAMANVFIEINQRAELGDPSGVQQNLEANC